MLINYLKIAWKVLLRRKFFTFVSLFGIAFTLLVLMTVTAMLDHLFKPARPGSKFDRCLFVTIIELSRDQACMQTYPSYAFLDDYVRPMNTPEAVSIHTAPDLVACYVRDQKLEFELKYTDAAFWDIMEYDFLEGRPYSADAVTNVENGAVITDYTRRQVFGDAPVIGQYLETTSGSYRVAGVIPRELIPTYTAKADIFVPITLSQSTMANTEAHGSCWAYVLAPAKEAFGAVKNEYKRYMDQARIDKAGEWDVIECPLETQMGMFVDFFVGNESGSVFLSIAGIIGLMVLFMLFPALNLVNINLSRIIERSSEIGVRKAFGASSRTLVGQFVMENIFLTVIGGSLAFVLTLIALAIINSSGIIPWGHLVVNPRVFLYCLLLCLFFGVFSGVLPAYRMSRLHPVEALKGVES